MLYQDIFVYYMCKDLTTSLIFNDYNIFRESYK